MTVLVSDSFNRANSTTTLGSTDSYNGGTAKTWQTVGSVWGISNNQAYNVSATNADKSYAYVDAGASAVSVSVIFATLPAGGQQLALRINPANYSAILLQYGSTSSGDWDLYAYDGNNTWTLLSKVNKATTAPATLKVTIDGSNNITVYLNGTIIMTSSSTLNSTSTTHGFNGQGLGTSALFDNFEIDDLITGSTSVPLSSTVKSTSSATATPTLTGSTNTPVALSSTVKSSSSVTSNIKNAVVVISSVKSNTSTTQTATIKNSVALGSTVKSNTSGAFKVANSQGLLSTAKSNTSATATIKSNQALSSTVKSNTSNTATLKDTQSLSSTSKSNTSTTNTVKDAIPLGSTNKSSTSATANITMLAQGKLSSNVKSNSTSSATLTVTAKNSLSSTVKSNTSEQASLSVNKPLSSTVKSSSASTGKLTDNKLISSTSKSSSTETANLGKVVPLSSTTKSSSSSSVGLTVGFIFISSTTTNRTSSTATAKSSLSLISNVKSKSNSSGKLIFLGLKDYQQIVEFVMTIYPQLDFKFTINPVNEFKVKI